MSRHGPRLVGRRPTAIVIVIVGVAIAAAAHFGLAGHLLAGGAWPIPLGASVAVMLIVKAILVVTHRRRRLRREAA